MTDNSKITIRNSAELCTVEIEGIIGVPEEWQFEEPSSRVATYEKFRQTVNRIAEIEASEVVVEIRSTGGDVNDALLIHDALRSLPARITTRCFGYTASAATVIAQAASEGCRMISANALYLVHRSSCAAEGNAEELEAKADMLRQTDLRLAELYAARSGGNADDFARLMAENNGDGRWLSPAETVESGLADLIIGEETQPAQPAKTESENPLARGWMRLKAAVAARMADNPTPLPSDDRNILHFGDPQIPATSAAADTQSAIAFDEGQKKAAPSAVLPAEDPSLCDLRRISSNEEAYLSDARSFAR